MKPASTSPEPAVASQGDPLPLTTQRPSGAAITVSAPFSSTTAPARPAPRLAAVIRSAELGATGQPRAIAMIDLETARLHLAFGSLLVLGLVLSRLLGA